jgi:methionine-rich copper-binding protein CopC
MMAGKTQRSMMVLGALAVLLPAATALHLRLVRSAPRDGEVVTTLPTEIRLWFSQKPEVGLTTVKLLREDSSQVELGKVARTDDSTSVKAPLEAALVPGTYTVSWRSVSKDGHAVRGTYHFNLVPAPPARKQAPN